MALNTLLNSCGHKSQGSLHPHKSDPKFGNTYEMLLEGKQVLNFHLKDALLCHLGHRCVPSSRCAKRILEVHYSRIDGHFKVEKTIELLQKYFYWSNLLQDVEKYFRSYTTCVISKLTSKKQDLYTPLPTPRQPWESILMDYLTGLPSTKHGNDYIFMVVERFSKMVILAACNKSVTAEATTKIFFEWVWVQFRIPHFIILYLDNRFLSTFWSSL